MVSDHSENELLEPEGLEDDLIKGGDNRGWPVGCAGDVFKSSTAKRE